MRRGYELNDPLLPVVAQPHEGSLPAAHSFVDLSPENLVLTALKKAEEDQGWIVHFYEFAGHETQGRLRLPRSVARVQETNLLEQPEREIAAQGNQVRFVVKPFEIKALKIEFSAAGR